MKKLFILLLTLSPFLVNAQEFSSEESLAQEHQQEQDMQRRPPIYNDRCGGFSDFECYGRNVGSTCFRSNGRTGFGICYIAGFGPSQSTYMCRCL